MAFLIQASDPQFYGQCPGQEATFTKVGSSTDMADTKIDGFGT